MCDWRGRNACPHQFRRDRVGRLRRNPKPARQAGGTGWAKAFRLMFGTEVKHGRNFGGLRGQFEGWMSCQGRGAGGGKAGEEVTSVHSL